ncbi:hypothetical protein C3L33_23063, partial [Rhododendron williamsianum]
MLRQLGSPPLKRIRREDNKCADVHLGFISIDCGIPEGSDYKNTETTISYTSDAGYTDAGTNYNISSAYYTSDNLVLSDLRSFPQGIRNCYTLHKTKWHTVRFDDASDVVRVEIIPTFLQDGLHPFCLVDIGHGTPFISALELRQLNNSMYQTQSGSLKRITRRDFGLTADEIVRQENDSVLERVES